jgi:hypothetical protein
MSGNDEEEEDKTTGKTARERELEAQLAELEIDRQLLRGTYYATIEQVWSARFIPEAAALGEPNFTVLKRESAPTFVARTQKGNAYGETIEKAISPDYDMVSEKTAKSSGNSQKPATKAEIWPRDVLENTGLSGSEIAHLVPSSHRNASLYVDVAICALGLAETPSVSWETVQKAIHGARKQPRALAGPRGEDSFEPGPDDNDDNDDDKPEPEPHNPAKKRKLQLTTDPGVKLKDPDPQPKSEEAKDPEDNEPKDGKRKKAIRTGLKHLVSNKIRLASQKDYFDDRPCVLIVPVIDLATMKGWNGEGYKAIILVGDYDNGGDDRFSPTSATVQTVCSHITMSEPKAVADAEQIERARLLLEQVILGMAYSLKNRSGSWDTRLGESAKTTLAKLRTAFEGAVAKDGGVAVPAPPPMESKSHLRVRLVTFGRADIPDNKHPAPDPLLLAVRSAVNWSRRHGQQLLSRDEHPDIDDDLDVLAMEQHRDMQDRNLRPQTWEELAIGLGYVKREQQHGGAPKSPSSIPSW